MVQKSIHPFRNRHTSTKGGRLQPYGSSGRPALHRGSSSGTLISRSAKTKRRLQYLLGLPVLTASLGRLDHGHVRPSLCWWLCCCRRCCCYCSWWEVALASLLGLRCRRRWWRADTERAAREEEEGRIVQTTAWKGAWVAVLWEAEAGYSISSQILTPSWPRTTSGTNLWNLSASKSRVHSVEGELVKVTRGRNQACSHEADTSYETPAISGVEHLNNERHSHSKMFWHCSITT